MKLVFWKTQSRKGNEFSTTQWHLVPKSHLPIENADKDQILGNGKEIELY